MFVSLKLQRYGGNICQMKLSFTKIVGIALMVVIVAGVLLWQSSAIVAFFQGFSFGSSEHTTISLVAGQYITYRLEDSTYVFSYRLTPADQTNLFYVVKDVQQTGSYPATPGTVYHDLGLEIIVSSVTPDLAILRVKPLPE